MSATELREIIRRSGEHAKAFEDAIRGSSDEELVQAAYNLVDEHVADSDVTNRFFVVLGEAFERWAPEAEWASRVRDMRDETDPAFELEAARDGMIRRAEERIRARLAIPGDEEGGEDG